MRRQGVIRWLEVLANVMRRVNECLERERVREKEVGVDMCGCNSQCAGTYKFYKDCRHSSVQESG